MSNTHGVCNSFKPEMQRGLHALGTSVVRASTTPDTIKAALLLQSASAGPGTTTYDGTGEASGAGYSAGGVTVTNANTPSLSGTSGIWTPSAAIVYSGVTLASPVDAVLLYNSTQGNRAISVHTFAPQTILAGTLTLNMPTNAPGTALHTLS